jgi:Helitron helicase-like domain at N-terminus
MPGRVEVNNPEERAARRRERRRLSQNERRVHARDQVRAVVPAEDEDAPAILMEIDQPEVAVPEIQPEVAVPEIQPEVAVPEMPFLEEFDNPLYHPDGGPPGIQEPNPQFGEAPVLDQYIHHNPAHVARRPDIADDSAPEELNMGAMDQVCAECDAQFWQNERNVSRPYAYTRCCAKGAVRLPPIRPPPEYIQNLLRGRGREGKLFKENVRMINTKVSFASVSMKTDDFRSTRGVQTLRVGGSIKHNIGDIYPEEGERSKFMQCFFYGGENNDRTSWENVTNEMLELLSNIRTMIMRHNSFFIALKLLLDVVDRQTPAFKLVIEEKAAPANAAPRTYNRPVCNEVAAIIVNEGSNDATAPSRREVILHERNGGPLRTVPSTHSSYDPLSYVLTHIHGDAGWTYGSFKSKKIGDNWVVTPAAGKISAMDYYKFRLHTRDPLGSNEILQDSVTWGGNLYQQYGVDIWVKIEEERLNWMRFHQKEIKAESYAGLADAVAANQERDAGHYVVLASSHTGSPRYMRANYHDAMAIVGKLGKPDLFVTMTCNPKWPEITSHLRENEVVTDRPDLTSRVFFMKYRQLLDDLLKKDVLGKVIGYCATIEFQKRGLPHAHILLILREQDKPKTCDMYDAITRAELPDPVTHPRLRAIVTKQMIHGPCGVHDPHCVCMKDGVCTKEFPKQCFAVTTDGEGTYPTYRRRNLHKYTRPARGNRPEFEFDDSWVVPYNPWLLYKYNCHINVEICTSVSAVKYLYKYVFKGHDKAAVTIVPETAQGHQIQAAHGEDRGDNPVVIDEIQDYVDSRYIGAQEALWRIFGLELTDRFPPVSRLQLHLEDMQQVLYHEGENKFIQTLSLIYRALIHITYTHYALINRDGS